MAELMLVLQFDIYDPDKIKSHPGIRKDLFPHDLRQTLVTDFFGGVAQVETTHTTQGNDSTGWDELHVAGQSAPRDRNVPDPRNTSLPESVMPGHDLRAPTTGPKQDWIVLVVLIGLLWLLQRRTLGFRTGGVQGKAKVE
jgi:phosphatidylinositol glycan class K